MSKAPFLGIDLGLRHTGVAFSESGLLAQPLTTIDWTPPHAAPLMTALVALVKEREVATIVVGCPLNEDETPTNQSNKTERLIQQLEESLKEAGLSVAMVRVNEFLSTQDGSVLFPDADKDAAAAAVLLQDYLTHHENGW